MEPFLERKVRMVIMYKKPSWLVFILPEKNLESLEAKNQHWGSRGVQYTVKRACKNPTRRRSSTKQGEGYRRKEASWLTAVSTPGTWLSLGFLVLVDLIEKGW